MKLSRFGQKMTSDAAIVDLMADLGDALNVNPDLLFLGGGNPAQVPAFEQRISAHLKAIADDPVALHKLVGVYQSPKGAELFIDALVQHMNASLGWNISADNVAVTNGSQSAFFILINLLTGGSEGREATRQMVFPMMPEYLGYADQSSELNVFRSVRPKIITHGPHRFKYSVDFDALALSESDAALCVSRPTNPTGNVLSNMELHRLNALAKEQGIPLIVDCAYGDPFPGIVYAPEPLPYDGNIIYVLSCSKLGLPGARTGIVIAAPSMIEQIVKVNTVISLANGNLGPVLMTSLMQANELRAVCQDILLPFYRQRRDFAVACIDNYFAGMPYAMHEPEGAFFLWLWFPELPISSRDLYERLKAKGVLIMDGSHFFFGLDESWDHAQQCVRLSYCQSEAVIEQALKIMAQEINSL